MKRLIFFAYGVLCHLMFLAVFTYMALFVGNLLIPHTIDTPVAGTSSSLAILINLTLLLLFGFSHSIMARPAFKEVWTKFVPKPIERSTYVLVSNLVCILLMWKWCGIDTIVWDIQNPGLRAAMWALFAIGWALVPIVSLLINHFDLFGTRQVWLYLKGQEYQPLPFRVPLFYKRVRHPLYVGWAIAFWAIPTMTVGHLLFAGVLSVYMMIAAVIEERDLIAHFGKQYTEYRSRVPMFVPSLFAKKV